MKRFLFFAVVCAVLLTACRGENISFDDIPFVPLNPPGEQELQEALDWVNSVFGELFETDEPETPAESEPFSGIKCVEEFVRLDTGSILSILPRFDDINDVNLATLLNFAWANFEFEESNYKTEKPKDVEEGEHYFLIGITQYDIFAMEELLKAFLSPDFSLDNYDYKNYTMDYPEFFMQRLIWDEEENLIGTCIFTKANPGSYISEILNVYEEDGLYYVITQGFYYNPYNFFFGQEVDFEYMRENFAEYEDEWWVVWDFGYNIYTFIINENGNVNIISKLPYEGELP